MTKGRVGRRIERGVWPATCLVALALLAIGLGWQEFVLLVVFALAAVAGCAALAYGCGALVEKVAGPAKPRAWDDGVLDVPPPEVHDGPLRDFDG